jgi:quinol monooxygenase YgiN
MFVVTVSFVVVPAHAAVFLAHVGKQASDSLEGEPGCHRFDVCIDPDRPERVFLYEIYADAAAFGAHLETAHFKAFEREAGPMLVSKTVETWQLRG